MTFVKGYKIDRGKVAKMIEHDRLDPEVDKTIRIIVNKLSRDAYKYIATAKEHGVPAGQEDGHIALVIVLAVSEDPEALLEQEISVHESIEVAEPHVLVGPDIWEMV